MDIRSFFGKRTKTKTKPLSTKKVGSTHHKIKAARSARQNISSSEYFGGDLKNVSKAKQQLQKCKAISGSATPKSKQPIRLDVVDVDLDDFSKTSERKRKVPSPSTAAGKKKDQTGSQKRPKQQNSAASTVKAERSNAKRLSLGSKSNTKPSTLKAESCLDQGKASEKKIAIDNKSKKANRYYKNRGQVKPPRLGQTDVPKGHHDCLRNKTFVITGVLDSLERDSASELIKNHGGRVTGSVSRKTTFLVAGSMLEDGRPAIEGSKTKKAVALKVSIISEEELFDMIRKTKPEDAKQRKKIKKEIRGSGVGQTKQKQVRVKTECDDKNALWSVKYRPKNPNELIGNSQVTIKMKKWLYGWNRKYLQSNGTKRNAAQLKAHNSHRGVILSGPPGIGKTSAAMLIATALGYEVVEFNASDKRSKASMNFLSEAVNSRTMRWGGAAGGQQRKKQRVVIMDEVDGMSGSDRGGAQALALIIAKSQSPVICICNDLQKKSLGSLRSVCMGLPFRRPMKRSIAKRMQQVAKAEGLQIDEQAMEALVESVGNDIRQVMNALQMMSRRVTGRVSYSDMKERIRVITKDAVLRMTPFTAVSEIFNLRKSFNQRYEAFFVDYSLMPLLVQQNYASVLAGSRNVKDKDAALCRAAEAMADMDLMATSTGGSMNWALLKYQAALCLEGGFHANGFLGQANFPAWFGQNSKRKGRRRLLREMSTHMSGGLSFSVGPTGLRQDYLHTLRASLMRPLLTLGADGIEPLIEGLREYGLTREDLMEKMPEFDLQTKDSSSRAIHVASKLKSALTRQYNKGSGRISQGAALMAAKGIDKDKVAVVQKKTSGKKKKKSAAKRKKKAAGSSGKKKRTR